MKENRMKYSIEFYKECSEYINNGHSLIETAEKFGINYVTLRQNLTKLGFRKPNRKGKLIESYSFDDHYFDKIDTHTKAYFLGLLMADGYICKTAYSYSMGIALKSEDKYILDKLKEEMKSSSSITTYKNSNKFVVSGSKHLYDTLLSYNFKEDKSHSDYIIPEINNEFINSFIRGYFDGDGCITLKSSGYNVTSICCNSFNFLKSLQDILESNEIVGSRIKCEQGSRKNPLYILYLTTSDNQKKFRDFIYKNSEVKLLKKFEKFQQIR